MGDNKSITETCSKIDDVTVKNDSDWIDKSSQSKQSISPSPKEKDKNIQNKETPLPSFKGAESLERKPPMSSNEDVRESSTVAIVPASRDSDGKEIKDGAATSSGDIEKPCKRTESLKGDVTKSSTDALVSTPLDSDGKKIKHDKDTLLVK